MTHRATWRHGARHTIPGGTSVDEGVSRGVADQEDIHAVPARGVQEGHAGHGQGRKSAIRTIIPTVRGHASQAGACVRLRVHVPRRGKEARQLHAHNGADARDGQRGRDDPQPASRAVQGGGQAVSAAGRPGKHWQVRTGRAGGQDPDVQRGRVRREKDSHAGRPAEKLLESGLRSGRPANPAGSPPSVQVRPGRGP